MNAIWRVPFRHGVSWRLAVLALIGAVGVQTCFLAYVVFGNGFTSRSGKGTGAEYSLVAKYRPGTRSIWLMQEAEVFGMKSAHVSTASTIYVHLTQSDLDKDPPDWTWLGHEIPLENMQKTFNNPAWPHLSAPEDAGTCFWHERAAGFPWYSVHLGVFTVRTRVPLWNFAQALLWGQYATQDTWSPGVYALRVNRVRFLANVLVTWIVLLLGLVLLRAAAIRLKRRILGWWNSRLRKADPSADPCLICGYDCRASPERCPECGALRKGG